METPCIDWEPVTVREHYYLRGHGEVMVERIVMRCVKRADEY